MAAPTFTRPIQGSPPNQFVENAQDVAALNAVLLDLWHAIVSGADEQVIADLVTTLSGLRNAAQTAETGAVTAQGLAEAARDAAETYAGVVSQATSVAGLTDPTTLTIGDKGIVSGSGDDEIDGLYEVQDDSGNVWVRVGDTCLAGKLDRTQAIIAWARSEAWSSTSITRNDFGAVSSASIIWDGDGSEGTFTATAANDFGGFDGFELTHADAGLKIIQAAVTRDATGVVTALPALTTEAI